MPLDALNGTQKKQPMSRINSYKRDYSSSQDTAMPSSSQGSLWAPPPPSSQADADAKAAARARRLKAIEEAMADDTPVPKTTGKRNAPIDIDLLDSDDLPGPSAPKKRSLPHTWQQPPPTLKPSERNFLAKPAFQSVPVVSAPPISAKPVTIRLSSEQKHILALVLEGKNVFFTGSAGTGKSVLLRQIIQELRKKHSASDAVAITASTGIAACNIGGITLHSFAGVGLGLEAPNGLAAKVRKSKKAATRWMRTKVLIIDEISMVDGDLFDKLARLACILRGNQHPFGGIQVIVTGDFFQLPPVAKGSQAKFAFEAELWKEVVQHTFNLTQVFRQKDPTFVNMLNEMRFGRLSQKSIEHFRALSRPIQYDDDLAPTELFPRREDVDRSNRVQLQELEKKKQGGYTYMAVDGGVALGEQREKLLSNFMAVKELRLTIGCQVMLIKNMEESLVNGSTGIVMGFADPATFRNEATGAQVQSTLPYPIIRFKVVGENAGYRDTTIAPDSFKVEQGGEVQASRTQLPLILSWAMSIHKSQGQTLERVKVDLGKVFEKGQAYVALSRATCLEGLQVLNFDASKVMAHPKVAEWSKTLQCIGE